jgi:hypothetical protein
MTIVLQLCENIVKTGLLRNDESIYFGVNRKGGGHDE